MSDTGKLNAADAAAVRAQCWSAMTHMILHITSSGTPGLLRVVGTREYANSIAAYLRKMGATDVSVETEAERAAAMALDAEAARMRMARRIAE